MEAAKRVAKGAEFLEEKFPGWREYVEADTLLMTSASRCVLGQIGSKHPKYGFENFGDVVEDLEKDKRWAMEHGFLTPCAAGVFQVGVCTCDEEGEELRIAWLQVIREES